jgi:hypothetical protein
LTTALNCKLPLAETLALLGFTVTLMMEMVTVAVADFEVSATLVAVTVTVLGEGATDGAVYRPLAETVPQVAPAQPAPVTAHVTLVLDVPVTVAVNCCVPPASTDAVVGLTVMETTAMTVTVAEADFVGSAALVAVTLTMFGEGANAGAVYRPAAVTVPQAAPLQPLPVTVQVTA